MGGDFFDSVPPGGVLYVLQQVILGFDDATSARLLGNCAKVLGERGRLLIIEQVLPPAGSSTPDALFDGAMSDLNMLIVLPGRERTETEYTSLIEQAGFRVNRIIPTASLMSVIEAIRS